MAEFFRRLSTRAPELGFGRSPTPRSRRSPSSSSRCCRAPGGLLGRHLRAQSLSRRAHRAGLRPPRARLAGPAGARLSAGLPAARWRWRWLASLRAGRARRRRHQLHRRAAVRLPARRPRPHALHRPRPRALDAVARLRRPCSVLHPTPRSALIARRPARAGPQAQAPLRRHPHRQPEIPNLKQRSNQHAGHSSGAHRPPRPDGRRRQRQGRLRAQLPAAAEEGAARHRGQPQALREGPRASSRRATSS